MQVTGNFELLRRIGKAVAELEVSTKGLSKVLSEQVIALVRKGFEEERAPDGTPWVPLKRQRSVKRRKKAGDRLLQDTGRLRNSISRSDLTAAGFSIGTDAMYAPFHQFGTGGRKQAYSRNQVVFGPSKSKKGRSRAGKFMSFAKAEKQKRGKVSFRRLNFQAGGGKIPARPFMPQGELSPAWAAALEKAALAFISKRIK